MPVQSLPGCNEGRAGRVIGRNEVALGGIAGKTFISMVEREGLKVEMLWEIHLV